MSEREFLQLSLKKTILIPCHRKYNSQDNQCDIPTAHDVKLRCNIVEYTTVFLYSDWLLVYWRIFADVIVYTFPLSHTNLRRESISLNTNWLQKVKMLVKLSNWWNFGSLGVMFEEKLALKTETFLGVQKRYWALTKRIQYIVLKFLGLVNRAIIFQYSEQMFLQLHQKLYHLC